MVLDCSRKACVKPERVLAVTPKISINNLITCNTSNIFCLRIICRFIQHVWFRVYRNSSSATMDTLKNACHLCIFPCVRLLIGEAYFASDEGLNCLPPISCMILSKLLNLLKPLFSHLWSDSDDSAYLGVSV